MAERLLAETRQGSLPLETEMDHQILALLVRADRSPPMRIIDVGGGVGQSWAALRRMVGDVAMQYEVVELPEVARRGRQLWTGDQSIRFIDEAQMWESTASVLFSKGYLQYSADLGTTMRRWLAARPRWLLLEKVPIVESHTYATVQLNVYGTDIPYWMINAADLCTLAAEAGYRLALRRRLERVYDQSGFPPEFRMDRASSLLFERQDSHG